MRACVRACVRGCVCVCVVAVSYFRLVSTYAFSSVKEVDSCEWQ